MSEWAAVWAVALLVAVFVLRWRLPTVAAIFGTAGVWWLLFRWLALA